LLQRKLKQFIVQDLIKLIWESSPPHFLPICSHSHRLQEPLQELTQVFLWISASEGLLGFGHSFSDSFSAVSCSFSHKFLFQQSSKNKMWRERKKKNSNTTFEMLLEFINNLWKQSITENLHISDDSIMAVHVNILFFNSK
jgi:hypothetical protein